MGLFVSSDQLGGTGTVVDGKEAIGDLYVITGEDPSIGSTMLSPTLDKVVYVSTQTTGPKALISKLANQVFTPSYSAGQQVNVLIVPASHDFVFTNGALLSAMGGQTLAPAIANLSGSNINPTNHCLVVYDVTENNGQCHCVVKTGGTAFEIPLHRPEALYHELSHAHRILKNTLLAVGWGCNPASAEESAAIADENEVRTQILTALGRPIELRDTSNACSGPCPSTVTPQDKKDKKLCIVATLASGSADSVEVQTLRQVRDTFLRSTEVGYAFFESLHSDYYAFAPQLCALVLPDPGYAPRIRDGFVRPLLTMLKCFQCYSLEAADDEQLGRLLLHETGGAAARGHSLAAVSDVVRFWSGDGVPDDPLARALARLLHERAMPSEHVRWGLVAPVRMYRDWLTRADGGADPAAKGRAMRGDLERWAEDFPVDEIWAQLTAEELAAEMRWVDDVLLLTAQARRVFRRRLRARFGEHAPIRKLLAQTRGMVVGP